ncbi:MAG: hypothetical protein AAF289_05915 [Cyanobacteria bacterium P01_A01_bin.135]
MNPLLVNLVNAIIGDLFEDAAGIQHLGDILIGNSGNNRLRGGDRDDLIFGFAGNDRVITGSGTSGPKTALRWASTSSRL